MEKLQKRECLDKWSKQKQKKRAGKSGFNLKEMGRDNEDKVTLGFSQLYVKTQDRLDRLNRI